MICIVNYYVLVVMLFWRNKVEKNIINHYSDKLLTNNVEELRKMAIEVSCSTFILWYVLKKYELIIHNERPQYHYTDINGFIGIMQNRELWATNTKFLNDKNECIECLKLGQEITREYSEACTDNSKDFLKHFHKVIQDRIDQGSDQDIYSISFCKEGDLLSQWRGYGKKGGIAIGFDLINCTMQYNEKEVLSFYNFLDRHYYETVDEEKRKKDDFIPDDGEFMIKLWKVIYNKAEQERILNDLIDIGIETVRQGTLRGITEEELVHDIMHSIDYLLPIFKDIGFEEEKEVRYIWRDDGSRKIYFREKNGIIIPYIKCMIRDCNCRELEVLPIKDIVVGPQVNQKEVIDGVKMFLQHNGYEYLVDKVRPSEIPYRE